MAYFPFFIDIEGKKCLIIGGGKVACRKAKMLLNYGIDLTIIATQFCDLIKELEEKVNIKEREFCDNDLTGVFLVIAATENESFNRRIARLCKKRSILVNVVDKKEECSFIFPALIRKGAISIGITTSGNSPVISQQLKENFENNIPDYYEQLVEELGIYREIIKKTISSVSVRTIILKELVKLGLKNNGKIDSKEVKELIEKNK